MASGATPAISPVLLKKMESYVEIQFATLKGCIAKSTMLVGNEMGTRMYQEIAKPKNERRQDAEQKSLD